MIRIDHVHALVIGAAIERVSTAEDDEVRLLAHPCHVEQRRKLRAGPFGNRAPPFDAIVAGDLRALRECFQFVEAEAQRSVDQPADREPPIGKAVRQPFAILRRIDRDRAVAANVGRAFVRCIFGSKSLPRRQRTVRAAVPALDSFEQAARRSCVCNLGTGGGGQSRHSCEQCPAFDLSHAVSLRSGPSAWP